MDLWHWPISRLFPAGPLLDGGCRPVVEDFINEEGSKDQPLPSIREIVQRTGAHRFQRKQTLEDFYLTPLTGSILLVLVVGCGHLYRDNWKKQEDGWRRRAWLYGLPAGLGLLALAFLPLKF